MKEYKVGDKVWLAKYKNEPVKKPCPICSGKLRVTVILGNGDHIETDCSYCERGFKQYGWVEEYKYVSDVEQITITGKEVTENENGREVKYRYGSYYLSLDDFSETKEEAEEKLKEKIAKRQAEDLEKTEYSKNKNPRKYSWDVGYYQRLRKNALEEIERCDRKIKYFKAKIKESK